MPLGCRFRSPSTHSGSRHWWRCPSSFLNRCRSRRRRRPRSVFPLGDASPPAEGGRRLFLATARLETRGVRIQPAGNADVVYDPRPKRDDDDAPAALPMDSDKRPVSPDACPRRSRAARGLRPGSRSRRRLHPAALKIRPSTLTYRSAQRAASPDRHLGALHRGRSGRRRAAGIPSRRRRARCRPSVDLPPPLLNACRSRCHDAPSARPGEDAMTMNLARRPITIRRYRVARAAHHLHVRDPVGPRPRHRAPCAAAADDGPPAALASRSGPSLRAVGEIPEAWPPQNSCATPSACATTRPFCGPPRPSRTATCLPLRRVPAPARPHA